MAPDATYFHNHRDMSFAHVLASPPNRDDGDGVRDPSGDGGGESESPVPYLDWQTFWVYVVVIPLISALGIFGTAFQYTHENLY